MVNRMFPLVGHHKHSWKDQRKPRHLRGLPLNPNAANEAHYYGQLRLLILKMTSAVMRDIEAFYKTPHAEVYFAEDATVAAQAKILTNALTLRFQKLFDIASKPLAEEVTGDASKSSALSLKMSLKQLSGGLTLKTDILTGELKDVLTATIAENVSLIKSIASEYLTDVQGAVYRSITTGNGLSDLVPFLKKHEGITLRRARIIANDQTRKAFSNLNAARMEKIGIDDYEWLHSAGGQKPRREHIAMSGKFYKLSDPPIIDTKTGQRGKPGDLINCRCRMIPVIRFDEG